MPTDRIEDKSFAIDRIKAGVFDQCEQFVRRDELATEIEDALRVVLEKNGLRLDNFILRNISFTAEYSAVIEQKQIAEQEVQRLAFVVQQRIQEAEQLRQKSQGEADAAVIASEGKAKAVLIEAEAQAEALRTPLLARDSRPTTSK